MEQLKQAILKQAGESWVDLIGFAARDRFDALDGAANPFSLFPEGKAAIMIGRRITRGALRGVEEGTNLADYSMFGQSWLNDTLISMTKALGKIIIRKLEIIMTKYNFITHPPRPVSASGYPPTRHWPSRLLSGSHASISGWW